MDLQCLRAEKGGVWWWVWAVGLPRHAHSPDKTVLKQNSFVSPAGSNTAHIRTHFLHCSTATTTQACETLKPKTAFQMADTQGTHNYSPLLFIYFFFQRSNTDGLRLSTLHFKKTKRTTLPAGQNTKRALVSMSGSVYEINFVSVLRELLPAYYCHHYHHALHAFQCTDKKKKPSNKQLMRLNLIFLMTPKEFSSLWRYPAVIIEYNVTQYP